MNIGFTATYPISAQRAKARGIFPEMMMIFLVFALHPKY